MFIKDTPFQVEFSLYAESHFCKDFYKRYKGKQWVETKKTITDTLERAFGAQQSSLMDMLKFSQEEGLGILKLDFKIAGTPTSPKASGNRVVVAINNQSAKIEVLLVYGKGHCDKRHSETEWIYEQIKRNFHQYKHLI